MFTVAFLVALLFAIGRINRCDAEAERAPLVAQPVAKVQWRMMYMAKLSPSMPGWLQREAVAAGREWTMAGAAFRVVVADSEAEANVFYRAPEGEGEGETVWDPRVGSPYINVLPDLLDPGTLLRHEFGHAMSGCAGHRSSGLMSSEADPGSKLHVAPGDVRWVNECH